MQDPLEISHGALGLLLLCLAGGALCAFPLSGRTVDRHGAAAVTRVLAVLNGACLVSLSRADGFGALAALVFLFGTTHGAMGVAMNAWETEVERRFDRVYMPGFHATFSLGAGLGALTSFGAAGMGLGLGPQGKTLCYR